MAVLTIHHWSDWRAGLREMRAALERGTFREDLYYRLNVVPVRMPALKDRREDILDHREDVRDRAENRAHRPGGVQLVDDGPAVVPLHGQTVGVLGDVGHRVGRPGSEQCGGQPARRGCQRRAQQDGHDHHAAPQKAVGVQRYVIARPLGHVSSMGRDIPHEWAVPVEFRPKTYAASDNRAVRNRCATSLATPGCRPSGSVTTSAPHVYSRS